MSTAESSGGRRRRSCVVVTMIAPGGHRSGSAVRIAATVRALSADHVVTVALVTDGDTVDVEVVDRCARWCADHAVALEVVAAPPTSGNASMRAVRLWFRSVSRSPLGRRRRVPARLRTLAAGADIVWVFHLYPFMAGSVPAHRYTLVDVDDLKERIDPGGHGRLAVGRNLHRRAVIRLRRRVMAMASVSMVSSPNDVGVLDAPSRSGGVALLANTADDPYDVDGIGVDAAVTGSRVRPGDGARRSLLTSDALRVVMVGNFSYRPNAQAASWFIQQVWPQIHTAVPSATFVLIGAGADPAWLAAPAGAGIDVLGEVADLTDELSRAAVSVAPVLAGTGTRVKIIEAFSWGLPVVSTSVGADGLDVQHGRDLLLADNPAAFAAGVISLLADRDAAARLGAHGRAVFETHHHPAAFANTVRSLAGQVGEAAAGSHAPLDITHVVLTRRFAGIERHVTTVAAAMAGAGHRVRILCPDPEVTASGMVAPDELRSVEFVAAANWRRAAWEVARRRRIGVVHVHTTESLVGAAVGLLGRSTPLVVTRHFAWRRWSDQDGQGRRIGRFQVPASGPTKAGPLLAAAQRWVEARVDQQVAVSRFVADSIDQPALVIHPGVVSPHERVPASVRHRRVLVLQRLEFNKATHVALRAWAASTLPHLGWMLDVVGDGSQRNELLALTIELGVTDSVVMHGHVADVTSLLAQTAMLMAPCPDEPFGLSVVEAMAAGVPVVAAGGGGHLETLGRVAGAGLFLPGDVAGATALLDRLGPDVERRQALAEAQFAVQQQRFDLAGQVEMLEGFYRRLVVG